MQRRRILKLPNKIKIDLNKNITGFVKSRFLDDKINVASIFGMIKYLKENKITIATAAINSKAVPYDQFEYTPPCALVMGTESTGLDQLWLNETNQNLMIPMADEVDSLNLSVSAGILMYHVIED